MRMTCNSPVTLANAATVLRALQLGHARGVAPHSILLVRFTIQPDGH